MQECVSEIWTKSHFQMINDDVFNSIFKDMLLCMLNGVCLGLKDMNQWSRKTLWMKWRLKIQKVNTHVQKQCAGCSDGQKWPPQRTLRWMENPSSPRCAMAVKKGRLARALLPGFFQAALWGDWDPIFGCPTPPYAFSELKIILIL